MAGEWRTMTLGEAIEINPQVSLERGEIYPFVDMQGVQPSSRNVRPSEFRGFLGGGSRFKAGDTLMARITPCLENGKVARFQTNPDQPVGHGSTEFIVIRGKDNVTDNGFAYYLTRSNIVRGYAIFQMTGSSGRQRVPTEALRRLQVSLPPLNEQRAIAGILGSLDDKIEMNRRMNETLEAMARAIFKSWFVDILPEGSTKGKFADVASLGRETVIPENSPEEQFDHYSIPAFDERRLPALERGSEIRSNKLIVRPNSILLSRLNPRIQRAWLPSVAHERRSICSTEFLVLLPRQGMSREWLYGLVSFVGFMEKFATFVTGTSGSHQRVKPESLLAMSVHVPPQPMMERFAAATEPIYARVSKNLLEAQVLAATRDALLPKLISGELRVGEVEKAALDCRSKRLAAGP